MAVLRAFKTTRPNDTQPAGRVFRVLNTDGDALSLEGQEGTLKLQDPDQAALLLFYMELLRRWGKGADREPNFGKTLDQLRFAKVEIHDGAGSYVCMSLQAYLGGTPYHDNGQQVSFDRRQLPVEWVKHPDGGHFPRVRNDAFQTIEGDAAQIASLLDRLGFSVFVQAAAQRPQSNGAAVPVAAL